jgi:FkbM family methyltransferase
MKDFKMPLPVDRQMLKESKKNYGQHDYKGKVCVDIGSNIGAFARIALDDGAKQVITFECDSRNFALLEENTKNFENVSNYHCAITAKKDETIQIYKSSAKSNHASTSTIKRTRTFKEYEVVSNLCFSDVLDTVGHIDVLKIDIEGGEYDLFLDDRIWDINEIFIEFHINNKTRDLAHDLMAKLRLLYPNHREKPIIYFNSTNGYDCYYSKS